MTEWGVDESPTLTLGTRPRHDEKVWNGKTQGRMKVNDKAMDKKANSVKHMGFLCQHSGSLLAWYGILG